ncbi:MAG: ATP-binding cassette domain-containing protein [Rhodothermales bacterium]|nr:ATP-binding cassette domain-containing protein [Rhodothermales bacterium]
MLALLQVSKSYDGVQALAPLDLALEPGRTTVLIGPSGCGKSTLLRLMNGLIAPSTGDIYFDGERLTPEQVRRMRHRMGYVIQSGGLFPHLTARANVTLLARHLGRNTSWINSRVDELAGLVQLPADRLARFPLELSGGQQQRVGLMRALMLDPDVLLLDEPLGALDPMIRADLQNDLRAIFSSLHKTVVLVTHDLHEAGFFGDTILLMKNGRIEQRGTIQELLDAPANDFVRAFVNAQRQVVG